MSTKEATALPELETTSSALDNLPARIDVKSLTEGLMPIVRELIAATDNAVVQFDGVIHDSLQTPVKTEIERESVKHYVKGVRDAKSILRRSTIAVQAFRKWERQLADAAKKEEESRRVMRESLKGGAH